MSFPLPAPKCWLSVAGGEVGSWAMAQGDPEAERNLGYLCGMEKVP